MSGQGPAVLYNYERTGVTDKSDWYAELTSVENILIYYPDSESLASLQKFKAKPTVENLNAFSRHVFDEFEEHRTLPFLANEFKKAYLEYEKTRLEQRGTQADEKGKIRRPY